MGATGSVLSSCFPDRPPEYAKFRRKPLSTADAILNSPDGNARLKATLDMHPPGTPFRWEKILKLLLTDLAPTKRESDPIRFAIDVWVLKEVLRKMYDGKRRTFYFNYY